jgi:hypothetical protein
MLNLNRRKQQAELLYKVGLLVSPLVHIVENPEHHDAHDRARAAAKFAADRPRFMSELRMFCQGEPGHDYAREAEWMGEAVDAIQRAIVTSLDDAPRFAEALQRETDKLLTAIRTVPVGHSANVHLAQTPFSTYCAIRDLCDSASSGLLWVDRYLDASVFRRYLRDTASSAAVTLIAWEESRWKKQQLVEFLDLSRLFAAERGPLRYRLVFHVDIHDRWLQCDDRVYTLGGSAKDAGHGSPFTITKLDPPDSATAAIHALLISGREAFGPAAPTHP